MVYMSSQEIWRDMQLNLARSKLWNFCAKYFLILHNCVKIVILETCLMIIETDSVESLLSFATCPLVYQ